NSRNRTKAPCIGKAGNPATSFVWFPGYHRSGQTQRIYTPISRWRIIGTKASFVQTTLEPREIQHLTVPLSSERKVVDRNQGSLRSSFKNSTPLFWFLIQNMYF